MITRFYFDWASLIASDANILQEVISTGLV